jgi:hypothetical protein
MLSPVKQSLFVWRRDRMVACNLQRRMKFPIALMGLLLAACSTPSPPQPAMVPMGPSGNYGYSEVMLQPDHYQVSYLTPPIKVSIDRTDRESEIAAAKTKTHDLALWRAAQLGREKGFSALKITDEHTDTNVNTNVQRSYQPSFYGYYGYGYQRRYPGGFGPVPWFPGDYPGYYPYDYGPGYGDYYERRRSSVNVDSRLDVQFFKAIQDDAQSIDTVIDDMTKKYAQATWEQAANR